MRVRKTFRFLRWIAIVSALVFWISYAFAGTREEDEASDHRDYLAGQELLQRGESEAALELLLPLTGRGYSSPAFQLQIAEIHLEREDVPQYLVWLERSALQGYDVALLELGEYRLHQGKTREAIFLIRQAALQEMAPAQRILAGIHDSLGNREGALFWYRKAAFLESPESRYWLSGYYFREKRYIESLAWLHLANLHVETPDPENLRGNLSSILTDRERLEAISRVHGIQIRIQQELEARRSRP